MEDIATIFSDKKIPLELVVKATENFSDKNLIREGGFGKVYRGNLEWSGEEINIAARKLHYDYGQGKMEFLQEISMLADKKNRLKHENLVTFIGFCVEEKQKIIIYKLEAKESLEKHLEDSTGLTWMRRLEICVGVARAMKHIHYNDEYDSRSVIHCNIKSSKILLDDNWKPKLCGFEHSKTNSKARRNRLVLAEIVGTIGYIDPTYEKTGFVTHKSDIYSFGVVLFEILCGRRAFLSKDQDECSPQVFIPKDQHQEEMQMKQPDQTKTSTNVLSCSDEMNSQVDLPRQASSYVNSRPSSHVDSGPPSYDKKKPVSVQFKRYSETKTSTDVLSCSDEMNSQVDLPRQVSSFVNSRPSSHVDSGPPSYDKKKPVSLGFMRSHADADVTDQSTSSPAVHQPANKSPSVNSSSRKAVQPSMQEKPYKLEPRFTMKRLDQYSHSPNEVLLARLATSHYEGGNLKDLINQALWEQIDPQSFKVFTETAFKCLKEQRAQRPNIDQILRDLLIALDHQRRRDFPEQSVAAVEVQGTSSSRWKEENLESLIKIPLADIELATAKFTKGFLAEGGYGKVYHADLEISKKRTSVAIKRIAKNKEGGEQGFDAEIEFLSQCRHDNIVHLFGFCDEGPDLILVYEHAPNGALDDYLASSNDLTWVQRLKISIDIAEGLKHLHTTKVEDEQTIIHRDIKSGNILLDENLVAKIADFGLSRFLRVNQQEKTHISNNIAGTEVYMCPEYRSKGWLKKAVDIYSFGIVLFEILSGKLAYDQVYYSYLISDVARERFKEGTLNGMIDPKIMEEVDELTSTISRGPNQDSLDTFIQISYRCVAKAQKDRPTAEEIVEELKKALSYQEQNKHNLQMSFEEIALATQNFIAENRIGRGGFGDVFKGEVKHANGCSDIVAKRWVNNRGQGENEFLTELEVLFDYKHENIISLLGYCNENKEKIIVYEYASNRSLDRYLEDASLTWMKRLQICIDVVRGLAFLHGGFITEEVVIHRDLKCTNILLDDAWKAKISDFGLSLITPVNQENIRDVSGTIGYVDPEYKKWGYLSKESDIYSLGVILFEVLHGKLVAPNNQGYKEEDVISFLKKIHEEGNRDSIVFEGIKEQIAPESLSVYQNIAGKCLADKRKKRPTAQDVLKHLNKALEVQEAYEVLQPAKLPNYYEEMMKMSISRRKFLSEKKRALYNMFSPGILLPKEKVWFSLGPNGERNEMISAEIFSYKNQQLLKWRSIPESRFKKVAKMWDISNLMIQIQIKARFLSPNVMYGVHLVFKFGGSLPSTPMYMNLTYQMGSETLHSYFATLREDKWMTIELYRFLNDQEDNDFEVLLESFSTYYCRSDVIYVEGIEFRAMDKVKIKENEQPKDVQSVLESNSNNVEFMQQLLIDNKDIIKRLGSNLRKSNKQKLAIILFNWVFIDRGEKLFLLSKVNGKRCHMLRAKAVFYDSSNVKFITLEPSADSRFQEAGELVSQHVFRVKCNIESKLLSTNTKYGCFLVFKLSEKCSELHCPVKIRNLLDKSRKIIYLRSPTALSLHDASWVPEQRQDGWMEVRVWEFNTNYELKSDHVPMDLKLISYEGTMCGLIIYGLEFRPM